MKKGRFIVVEGVEGTGKSSAMTVLSDKFKAADIDLHCTREPGGTPVAEKLRNIVLHTEESEEIIEPTAELLMIFAARAQHLAQEVLPRLDKGQWVLCDRFVDSSYAYQGAGRGLDETLIRQLEEMVCAGLKPDLTILMDVPVKQGLERSTRDTTYDRFENQDNTFHEQVRACFLKLAKQEPQRYMVIDTSPARDVVTQQLLEISQQIIDKFK